MFQLEMRQVRDDVVTTKWVPIWTSEDGADCAEYMKSLVEAEAKEPKREYRMVYKRGE